MMRVVGIKKKAQAATTIATEIEAWLRGSMAFVNSMVTESIVLQKKGLVKWFFDRIYCFLSTSIRKNGRYFPCGKSVLPFSKNLFGYKQAGICSRIVC
jgi:hypothetical protein